MSKILITGGAGFIGAHLANKLKKDNKIMIVDSLENKGGIPFIDQSNIFIKGNILEKKILNKIERWKPNIIYHLAAQSGGEGAYDDPKKDYNTNGFGTYLIANLAKKIKCKYFIYTSTVAVYGSSTKKITENSKISPDSIYGISKYTGEMFVNQILKKTNVKVRIFRIFNTFGPGENLNNSKKGMVSIYCSYIWKKKPLIIKGSLNRYRNFTYISDCVNILAESIKNNKLNKFEIFNLSNGIKTTVKDLIKVIFKTNNIKKCKIINENNTPGDSFGYDANNLYLKKKFNNYKFLKLEEGIKKYFLWINMIKKKNLNNSHPYKINKDYKL
jgi:UDP-glucose 4-epimerase